MVLLLLLLLLGLRVLGCSGIRADSQDINKPNPQGHTELISGLLLSEQSLCTGQQQQQQQSAAAAVSSSSQLCCGSCIPAAVSPT